MTPLQEQGYTTLAHIAKIGGGPAKYMREHDLGMTLTPIFGIGLAAAVPCAIYFAWKNYKQRKLIKEYIEKETNLDDYKEV